MRLDLRGTTALVTGAGSGIGAAIAEALARRGAVALVLVGRRRERLEEVARRVEARGTRALVRAVDLRDRAATEAMIASLEREGVAIDVLVNNAGFGDRSLFERRAFGKLEALLELNVVSATFLLHRLLPGMLARRRGGILNVGSIAGIVPRSPSAVYGASKAYLNLLSEALHAELSGTGVVVTAALPGPIPTEFGVLAAQEDAAPVRPGSGRGAAPTGLPRLPGPFAISAQACAEEAVAALEAGRPRVVTGLAARALARVMERMPRFAVRAFMARRARRLRGR